MRQCSVPVGMADYELNSTDKLLILVDKLATDGCPKFACLKSPEFLHQLRNTILKGVGMQFRQAVRIQRVHLVCLIHLDLQITTSFRTSLYIIHFFSRSIHH